MKTGSSKKTRNLRTGALRPPNAFFHATFTLGQSGGNVKQTTVAIIKGSTCTRHEEGHRGTYCTRYNFNSYVVFSLTWKPLALILSRLYIHTAHHWLQNCNNGLRLMRDMNFSSSSTVRKYLPRGQMFKWSCIFGPFHSSPCYKESYHIFRFCIISQMLARRRLTIAQSQLVFG